MPRTAGDRRARHRRWSGLLAACCLLAFGVAHARASTLVPDTSYAGTGNALFSFADGLVNELPWDVAVDQSTGTAFVVGGAGADAAILSVLANGSPNTAFSDDGKLLLDLSTTGNADSAYGVALHGGDLVVVGDAQVSGADYAVSVAVLDLTGRPRTSFGGDGIVHLNPGPGYDAGRGIGIDSAAKLWISGQSGGDTLVASFKLADGTPNDAFSGDGFDVRDLAGGGRNDSAPGLTLDADANVIAAGTRTLASGFPQGFVAEWTPGGELRTGFAGDGVVEVVTSTGFSVVASVTRLANGLIIAGGGVQPAAAPTRDSMLVVLNPDGTPAAVGTDGVLTRDLSREARGDFLNDVALTITGNGLLFAGGVHNAAGVFDPLVGIVDLDVADLADGNTTDADDADDEATEDDKFDDDPDVATDGGDAEELLDDDQVASAPIAADDGQNPANAVAPAASSVSTFSCPSETFMAGPVDRSGRLADYGTWMHGTTRCPPPPIGGGTPQPPGTGTPTPPVWDSSRWEVDRNRSMFARPTVSRGTSNRLIYSERQECRGPSNWSASQILTRPIPPTVNVTFVDGTVRQMNTSCNARTLAYITSRDDGQRVTIDAVGSARRKRARRIPLATLKASIPIGERRIVSARVSKRAQRLINRLRPRRIRVAVRRTLTDPLGQKRTVKRTFRVKLPKRKRIRR